MRLAPRFREHHSRCCLQIFFAVVVEDAFHREGVLDREEGKLGAELRARRPEVA